MTRSLTVDLDGPIHYLDHGGHGPKLVLIHGLGGSHINWIAVAPLLAETHRVFAVDLPGFGRSPFSGRSGRLEENAELLGRFIDHVTRGGQATLIGNSMGGLLSMRVAATDPALVRSLILVGAPQPRVRGVTYDRHVAVLFATYMLPFVGELVMTRRAKKLTPAELVDQTLSLCTSDVGKLDREIIAAHVALATERKQMPWAQTAFLAAARSVVRSLLKPGWQDAIAERIVAPTLLIHGERDRLVPVAAAHAAARRLGWDIEVLSGVGHIPQLEEPQRFVQIVERWLARVHVEPKHVSA